MTWNWESAYVRTLGAHANAYVPRLAADTDNSIVHRIPDYNIIHRMPPWKPNHLQIRGGKKGADDRKRYTPTILRHRAVQQNTPRFLAPIRDPDWINSASYRFLTPTPCGTSHRGFSARPSSLSDMTRTAFCRKIYHADRLCPRLFAPRSLSNLDRISTMGATSCSMH